MEARPQNARRQASLSVSLACSNARARVVPESDKAERFLKSQSDGFRDWQRRSLSSETFSSIEGGIMRALIVVFIGCLVSTGCSGTPDAGPPVGAKSEDFDIDKSLAHEVSFTWLIQQTGPAETVFLSFGGRTSQGTDPSDEFLAKYASLKRKVRKGSRAIVLPGGEDGDDRYVYDRDTKEAGVLITVGDGHHISGNKVEVDWSVYRGRSNGYGGTFVIEKKDANWTIVELSDWWES